MARGKRDAGTNPDLDDLIERLRGLSADDRSRVLGLLEHEIVCRSESPRPAEIRRRLAASETGMRLEAAIRAVADVVHDLYSEQPVPPPKPRRQKATRQPAIPVTDGQTNPRAKATAAQLLRRIGVG